MTQNCTLYLINNKNRNIGPKIGDKFFNTRDKNSVTAKMPPNEVFTSKPGAELINSNIKKQ